MRPRSGGGELRERGGRVGLWELREELGALEERVEGLAEAKEGLQEP